jgi:hypothetical protein
MLSVEVRLKIWKLALQGPRIVEVYLDQAVPDLDGSYYHGDILKVSIRRLLSCMLTWNHEALNLRNIG